MYDESLFFLRSIYLRQKFKKYNSMEVFMGYR